MVSIYLPKNALQSSFRNTLGLLLQLELSRPHLNVKEFQAKFLIVSFTLSSFTIQEGVGGGGWGTCAFCKH